MAFSIAIEIFTPLQNARCVQARVGALAKGRGRSATPRSKENRGERANPLEVSRRIELVHYGHDAPVYSHGPRHPLRPDRVTLTYDLIHALGLTDGERVVEVLARDATDDELGLVHTAEFIEATRLAGHGRAGRWERFGYDAADNPIFNMMHEAGARVVGATLTGGAAVLEGRCDHAFNPAGGLHHAMPGRASGFCVYNDLSVTIAWLLEQGVERVAYVDVDVHHGDGVQAAFEDDPRVLTISLHQDGRTLFPGTGFVADMGRGRARGTKVNVPLPPGTGDAPWLRAFHAIVAPLVAAFRPFVLVTQLGCDTHFTDPLADFRLTTAAYRETAQALHALAHEVTDGRWLATGGGGYRWASVVPRAWTLYFAEMVAQALPHTLPAAWVAEAEARCGCDVPATFSEPAIEGEDVQAQVDEVIEAVRRDIFPWHGLPPRGRDATA